MNPRTEYTLRFADGGTLDLGRRTAVMGVLNVTPDSFSDGGKLVGVSAAVDAAVRMAQEGAEIIDIGGESTRPGASPVGVDEELQRVLPVVSAIRRAVPIRLSIDTMKAAVALRALEAGADMVNDVSGLRDPEMLPVLCRSQAPVVLMHMRGTPATMQSEADVDDLIAHVTGFLQDRVQSAIAAGLSGDRILVDPGIGFGKSTAGNLTILRELHALAVVGRPILIGASRKTFIGGVLGLPVEQRLEGSLAVAAYACAQGAHVIRAHDVAATVRAVRVIDAIRRA